MSKPPSHSKRYLSGKSPKAALSGAALGLRRAPCHRLLFVLTGIMVCITTLAFSPALADISNVVRFSCMALMLLLGCLITVYNKNIPFTIGTVAFALFVLFQAASMFWSTNRAEALFEVGKWVMVFFTVLFSYNLFRQYPARSVMMMVYVSAAVFVISFAVALVQIVEIGDLSRANRYGIVSLFTHKGTYSMMMLLTMAFPVVSLCLHVRKIRMLSVVVIIVQTVVLFFLQARAAWLAGMATVGMLLLLWPLKIRKVKTQWRLVSVFVIAWLIAVVVVGGSRYFAHLQLPGPDQRGGVMSNASIYERQSLWRMTFRMIDEKPLAGCGAGNWKVCYPSVSVCDVFSIDMLDYQFIRPHNDYLRILSETGYVSLALILLALSSLIVNAAITAGSRLRYGKLAKTSVAFFVGVLVFAVFDFPLDRMELLLWVSILCGAIMVFSRDEVQVRNSIVFRLVSGMMLVLVFFVGACHWRSELYYSEIVKNIHRGKWRTVEQLSNNAYNSFCNLSPMAVPYAYYESMAREYQRKPAIETFRIALQESPYNKKILTDLGRLEYVENHDVKQAIAYLEEAIRISPAYSYAYFNLAQVYIQEKQYQKALEVLNSMDLEYKHQQMWKMVWHYHQDETGNYYVHDAVPAEKNYRDRMVEQIEALL